MNIYHSRYENKSGLRAYRFTASTDGTYVDYETIIYSKKEWGFWECERLAHRHGCTLWSIERMKW